MIKRNRFSAWLKKHWSLLRNRPKNGQESLENINIILREIASNGNRVNEITQQLVNDTADARMMIEDVTKRNRT
jgi:hypothetical protein